MLEAVLLAAKTWSSSYIFIIYVLVFGALYFFYFRPRSKRQKAARTAQRRSRWANAPRPSADSWER